MLLARPLSLLARHSPRYARVALSSGEFSGFPSLASHPRSFSSGTSKDKGGLVQTVVAEVSHLLNTYGALAGLGVGGAVVVYGVSSLALSATGAFLSLTLTDALYWGFASGFLSAGIVGLSAVRGYRYITIRTDPVFNVALGKLRENEEVASMLGANIQPGLLKAYVRSAGHFSPQKFGWVDPRVQMLFNVTGKDTGREGMVTVEAIKHNGVLKITLLALDITPLTRGQPASPPIMLRGTEEKLHVQGQLRGFIQGERAAYIPQDLEASDAILMAEQQLAEQTAEEDKQVAEKLGGDKA